MKRYLFFIGLLLTFSNLTAQKKVTKTIESKNVENVYVHVKFANNIIVKNWNKNEVSVEATVNLDDNEHNDYFTLKADKVGKMLKINSDYGDYFKKYRSYYSHKHSHKDEDKNTKKEDNDCHTHSRNNNVNYVIYVPKKIELKIKSISGNVATENYTGILNLNLISGNITVKKHSKDMHLKTISGDIDIFISDAKFEAKTLTGGIYSDLDIDFNQNKKKTSYGSKIVATIKKGTASLKLNTISGDIFLRKI
ncbi:DUF4097 family beta strand repeat protein [Polaribacter batillariae]|uniref:DUF4097 family beta strand repeat protein n=1 Tax=Polaribacter batillariae TaxID=2808900 RepID=A0ABX7SZS0_9FLAO|nr:DUF4097 family beta strand repeat-containing protein [Polaribacter batillariae]QTD39006.1 DUF4097 family beta strand repeat protein [Polaribacter batillariae]